MKLVLRRKHPKGFGIYFRNLDLNVLFSKRDIDWFNSDRDFCVYGGIAPDGKFYYLGMGRYREIDGEHCRAVSHNGDMLSATITAEGKCVIFCIGCTSKEAHIIEAQLIKGANSTRSLSKRGRYVGDGESLINKRREKKYERMIKEYLNLDGNNCWEALRREVDGN